MTEDLVGELMKVALLGAEWVLWLLLILSVLSLGAWIERWWFFRNNRRLGLAVVADVERHLTEGDINAAHDRLSADRSVEGRVVFRALRWRSGGPSALQDGASAALAAERDTLEKSQNLFGTLGNNAPFIGLFGTVIGVIVAFHHLGGDGTPGSAAMDKVMFGIAEALVATGVGIFVAIPAVVAFNIGQKNISDVEARVERMLSLLTAWTRSTSAGERDHQAAE